jgi:hypothetical protein
MFEYDDPRQHGGTYGDWANPEDIAHPQSNPFWGFTPTHDTGLTPCHLGPVQVAPVAEHDPCHLPERQSDHTPCHTPHHQGRWAEGKR